VDPAPRGRRVVPEGLRTFEQSAPEEVLAGVHSLLWLARLSPGQERDRLREVSRQRQSHLQERLRARPTGRPFVCGSLRARDYMLPRLQPRSGRPSLGLTAMNAVDAPETGARTARGPRAPGTGRRGARPR